MGKLYRGQDTQTGEAVAVKALKPEIMDGNPELVARFIREGEALRQLDHPNIVKMLAAVFGDGRHYLIMEYVSGGDLRQLLEREAPLPIPRIIEMGLDLADALTRAHRLDIIHRDLKPANILIAADGTPRLTDFGVAHGVDKERLTGPRTIIGTLDYLSPEVLKGETLDARADIWAFGVLLYEMLVGEPPFAGTNTAALLTAILNQPIPDLEQLRPDIPVALVDLIYRMLEKDRHARIASIRHAGAALEDILHDRAGPPAPKRFETPRPDTAVIARPRHNLPAQTTPFVGREDELSKLAKLLDDPDIRLITILAPGGMGKSRLALELAERIVSDGARSTPMPSLPGFANGVYFVSLASLSARTEIVPSIAEAIGFHFRGGGEQKQQIIDFLREKEMLLLMDNYEHLMEGAGFPSEILAAAPGVQILVTSRERLRLQEETLFRIEGMEFPDWQTPEEALEYGATRLFMQSARRMQPGFHLQADDLQHVAAICRQVQGMPLAIVLGAAWVEALSLPEIAAEIARCLDFLEADAQNVPERHRSIRAVFNPTWNRLNESEQGVFKKLSVFRGGFTREAAHAVAGADLRMLTGLLGKSLLRRDPNSGRYDIHELLRQYAEDHLMASPDLVSEVRDRHCAYYAAFLQAREDELHLGRQKETASDMATDIDNIRLAWSWACQYAKAKEIKQMVLSVLKGYLLLNLDMEALNMAEEAIRSLEAAETTVEHEISLAFTLCIPAVMGIRLGQIEKAKAAAERSCHIFETLDLYQQVRFYDPRELLGVVYAIQGNFAATEGLGDQIHRDHEGSGKKLPLATAFYMLTIANRSQGRFEAARTYAQQAYTNAYEAGDRLGELDEARELYQKGYAIHKDFNDS
jgi:serine/threonine protein kinase/tetratricopeptide (TPR) repeat protein